MGDGEVGGEPKTDAEEPEHDQDPHHHGYVLDLHGVEEHAGEAIHFEFELDDDHPRQEGGQGEKRRRQSGDEGVSGDVDVPHLPLGEALRPSGQDVVLVTLVLDPDPPARRWTAEDRRNGVGWGTTFPASWTDYGTPDIG